MTSNFKGDQGFTDLIGESVVSKADLRIKAIGAVDEAWAALGLARSFVTINNHKATILQIQKDLYMLMAQLAGATYAPEGNRLIDNKAVEWLEREISAIESQTLMPESFITSGDTPRSGFLALARTIMRRAEREVVALANHYENMDKILIKYLNRLSMLCFMIELSETSNSN